MNYQQGYQQNNQGSVFVISVSGEQGANMYPVAPGNTVVAFDWNNKNFWIKSTDTNGLPQATRKFSFEEETPPPQEPQNAEIQTLKDEMAQIKEMLKGLVEGKGAKK